MGTKYDSSPPNLDPILSILRDVKKDGYKTREVVESMNRELGGVQVALTSIADENKKQDVQIAGILKNQIECPARTNHGHISRRLKEVSRKLDEESTGNVNVYPPRKIVRVESVNFLADGSFRDLIFRMLPLLVAAFVVGIGTLAMIYFKFGGGK